MCMYICVFVFVRANAKIKHIFLRLPTSLVIVVCLAAVLVA